MAMVLFRTTLLSRNRARRLAGIQGGYLSGFVMLSFSSDLRKVCTSLSLSKSLASTTDLPSGKTRTSLERLGRAFSARSTGNRLILYSSMMLPPSDLLLTPYSHLVAANINQHGPFSAYL